MPANFVHLRLHSAYSLAESTLRIKDLSALIFDDKQPGLLLLILIICLALWSFRKHSLVQASSQSWERRLT